MKHTNIVTHALTGAVLFTAAVFAILMGNGCASTTSSTQYLQPDINFTSKLPLRAVLYVSDSIRALQVPATPTGGCTGSTVKVAAGDYYIKAIRSGLATAVKSVTVVDQLPAHTAIENYDVLVTVAFVSANCAATVTTEKQLPHIHSRFETTVFVKYTSAAGDSLYAYHTSEEGYDNELGTCDGLQNAVVSSIENCMHGLADYIANATYSATPLNLYYTKSE